MITLATVLLVIGIGLIFLASLWAGELQDELTRLKRRLEDLTAYDPARSVATIERTPGKECRIIIRPLFTENHTRLVIIAPSGKRHVLRFRKKKTPILTK